MKNLSSLRCDGCGQFATPEHMARRLARLEGMTRYRPVHIGTVFLGGVARVSDAEFLYSQAEEFAGEAQHVLAASGIVPGGKTREAVLTEFQRGGFLLTHVVECPLEDSSVEREAVQELLKKGIAVALTRLRRSFKPKRIAVISTQLAFLAPELQKAGLDAALIWDHDKPFALDGASADDAAQRLRQAISVAGKTAR